MTPWEAYQAGKVAGCESYMRDLYNSPVMARLACSSWVLRSKGWPVDDRTGDALRMLFRQGWDVGAGGEAVEA
jgi:hypothetical protein